MKLKHRVAILAIRTKYRLLSAVSTRKAAEFAFKLFCTPQLNTVKPLTAIFNSAEHLGPSFQGFKLAGYRWQKGNGRKVLLLHGFESSAVNFQHFVAPLLEKGYEVLAFDAPAHGRSSGKSVNAVVYKDFIHFLDETYGPIDSFVGHSFGGLALALTLAEIKDSSQRRAVFIAPATETSTAIDHFFRLLGKKNKKVRDEFEKIIFEIGQHPVEWFSVKRALSETNVNLLWIHDKDDKVTPLKDVENIRNTNYPNIQFVITEGLGHRRIYRDAEVGKTIVDFV